MFKPKRIAIVALILGLGVSLYFLRFSPGARKTIHLKRGESYYQAKDYESAKLEYLNVLRRDPSDKRPVQRLAAMWMDQGAPIAAMPYLQRLKQMEPSNGENARNIVQAFLAAGDLRSAYKEALELVKRAPQDSRAWALLADSVGRREDLSELEQILAGSAQPNPGQEYALGSLAFRRGDITNAEARFRKVLSVDPQFVPAQLRLTDIAIARNDRKAATDSAAAAAAMVPPRSLERVRQAEVLFGIGQANEARKVLNEVIAQAADYLPALIFLAHIESAEKKFDEALRLLDSVFKRDSGNFGARLMEAQVKVAKGDLSAGIESLDRLANAFPNAAIFRFELGRAHALAGRTADAATNLRMAISLVPVYTEAQVMLAELELRAGQFQSAADLLENALSRAPRLAAAQNLLAAAYRGLKRFDAAAAIYRKQSEASPSSVAPLLALGRILKEQKKLDEARSTFERALSLAPEDFQVLGSLVEIDLLAKNYADAMGRLAALDASKRDSAEAKTLEAGIHITQQQWAPAEAALLKAIEANPQADSAYQLLVAVYLQNGRAADAIRQLRSKLEKTPADLGSRILLARLCEQQSDFPAARAEYEKVIAQNPGSFIALNNLAYLISQQFNDLAAAADLAQKAHALQPRNPAIADTLAWILFRQFDFENAANLMREAVARVGEMDARAELPPEMNYHLGMILAAMGDFDAARPALEKASAATADFPGKSDVRTRLELLSVNAATDSAKLEELRKKSVEQPRDPVLQFKLGELLHVAGKAAEAAAAFEQALKSNPKFAWAAVGLAQVYALTDPARAIEHAKAARALAPSDSRIASRLGAVVAKAGDVQWAYSLLQQGAASTTAPREDVLDFALAAYRLGKVTEARQALDRAAAGDLEERVASTARQTKRMIEISESASPVDGAVQEVDSLLAKNARDLPALMAQAAIREQAKDLPAALAAYERILAEAAGFPLAQVRLAALLLETGGDPERARSLAEASRIAIPDYPLVAWVLGQTSFLKKQHSRAVDLLTEASRSKPLDAKRLYQLGASYFHIGNKTRAKEMLERAIAAGLSGQELADAKDLIEKAAK